MNACRVLFCFGCVLFVTGMALFASVNQVAAATCSISSATVINQAYVTANSCTSIDIQGNVSTTWIGTVDLGGGTVTVKSGYTMTMGSSSQMVLGANDDFVVESNATTTHLAEDPYGIQITARNITVSGKINADEKGCRGGVSSLSMDGYWPSTVSGVCTAPTSTAASAGRSGGGGGAGGTGASHAGVGGAINGGTASTTYIYGDALSPTLLGSGGGGGYYGANAKGGNGGGRIALTLTGTLTITGSISAKGGPGLYSGSYSGGGGGSGGSISISAPTVSGAGTVSAAGGTGGAGSGGVDGGGGGGGGRIALKYDSLTGGFAVSNVAAAGGSSYTSSWRSGGSGSTYILDRTVDDGSGTLSITSGFDFPFAGDYSRDTISVASGAMLRCAYAATTTSMTVSAVNWLTLSGVNWECNAGITNFTLSSAAGLSTTNTVITFGSATSVTITAPSWTNVTTTIANYFVGSSMAFNISNDLTLRGANIVGPAHAGFLSATGGFLTIPNTIGLTMVNSTINASVSSTLSTVSIDAQSSITATGKGCYSGVGSTNAYGPNASTGICTVTGPGAGVSGGGSGSGGVGGGHGGAGGTITGLAAAAAHGTSTSPGRFGSGGGGGFGAAGGNGGGVVMLTITGSLTLDGVIASNGSAGSAAGSNGGGGGGAGGSISLRVSGAINGSGSITANGGNAGASPGYGAGGGAGGRIAIWYGSAGTFSFTSVTTNYGTKTGSSNAYNGGIGTTFILDRVVDDGAGTLTIPSGFDFPLSGDYTRDTINISSGATLSCAAATGTSLTVSSTNWLSFSNVSWSCSAGVTTFTLASSAGISTTSTSFSFGSVTSVIFAAPAWTNVTTTITTSYAGAMGEFDIGSNLSLVNFTYTGPSHAGTLNRYGGILTIKNSIALSLVSSTIYSSVSSTQLSSLSIDSLSSINASGRGCSGGIGGGNGYGPVTSGGSSGICTITTSGYGKGAGGGGGGGGGAAHGGTGGASDGVTAQTTSYDSNTEPDMFGSGGGGGYSTGGGYGGGLIRIRVSGALSVSGSIKADGATPTGSGSSYSGGGGGAGGSIYLYVGSLAGSGTISAVGGRGFVGGNNNSGGGGGGRIAIYYSGLTFSGTSSTAAGASGGGAGANAGTVGTIYTYQTNQTPSVPSSLGSAGLVNGSTTGTTNPTFVFTLSDGDVSDTVKFQIQIDDSSNFGSAVIDYTSALAAQGQVSFQVGQAAGSGSYSVGSSGQTLSDGSYYWRVKAIDQNAAESSYTTANSGSVAFIVDSATRSVSFQLGTGSGLESVTATSIRIVLDTTHFENVTVNYAVSSTLTTATGDGTDYTLTAGTATITAGQTSTTIPLTVVNDDIDEPHEIVGIELFSPVYASLGVTNSLQYTITDNDTAGITLTEVGGSTSVAEGGATDTFTLVLTSQPTSTVRVSFATSTYGVTLDAVYADFTSLNWSTPQTITVAATNDDVDEVSLTTASILSTVSVPSGYAYGYDGVTISDVAAEVTDNDTAGVTLSKTTAAVTEGGVTDSYTLVLTSQPTSTVRIAFATSTYGVTLSQTVIDFTDSTWNTPQSITITATNDQVAEGAMATSVTHSLTVPTGYAYGYSSGVSIENMATTITDNDTAGISASTNSVSVTEGGSAQTMTYVLDTMPTSTVTLTFTTSTKGITVSPMTMSFTSLNWNTPQTLSITATDDESYEATHSTTVHMEVAGSVYGYPAVTPPTVTVTITDNDTSSITLSASTFTIREGASDSLTIVLTSQPTSTVMLGFTVPNQLRISPSSVSFDDSTWSTPQTVTITPVDDDRYAGTRTETIQVRVTTETAFASAEVPNFTVTITDNEQVTPGGGASAGAGVAIPIFIPLPPLPSTAGPTTNPTSFSVPSPTAEVNARVEADLRAFKVKAAEAERARFTTFVRFGSGPASQALGEGERRAVLRDALETMRRSDIPQDDLERIASGQIPKTRNIDEERKQVARALPTFKSIFGQAPDFSNQTHNLAWNTLLYRIRFPRDLKQEQQGIKEFKQLFGRAPRDPFQWSVVRVLGYVQK